MTEQNDKFQNLIMESEAFGQLKADADNGCLSHAYALISPDRTAARLMCKLFMAYAIGGGKVDSAVGKRVFSGSYLDILWFPRGNTDGTQSDKLTVSDVDYLTETAFVLPAELNEKWIVLCSEEPIGEPVQNKLLKTLEEPPEHTRFLLCAGSQNDLLPTVLSRCRTVKCEEYPQTRILQELLKYYPDKPAECELAAACCRGQIGLGERMVTDPKYRDMYNEALTTLSEVQRSPQIAHRAQMWLARKDSVPGIIDFMQLILRDVLTLACGCDELAGVKSRLHAIEALREHYSPEAIIKIMPLFQRAKRRIRSYGNINSIVDELLFSILEVKAQCKR